MHYLTYSEPPQIVDVIANCGTVAKVRNDIQTSIFLREECSNDVKILANEQRPYSSVNT